MRQCELQTQRSTLVVALPAHRDWPAWLGSSLMQTVLPCQGTHSHMLGTGTQSLSLAYTVSHSPTLHFVQTV